MTVGLASFGGKSFNQGKTQINLGLIQSGGDFPYLNLLKTAQAWSGNSGTTPVLPSELNSDGYPISRSVFTVLFSPTQTQRPGNYVITCAGSGTMSLGMNNTVLPTATFTGSVTNGILTAGAPSGGTIQKGMSLGTGGIVGDQISGSAGVAGTYNMVNGVNAGSQSMTVSGGSLTASNGGRYVFSTTDFRFVFRITTFGSPVITDVKIFHVDDEAAINRGEVFGTKFKAKLREGNFGVIRFSIGWQDNNSTNVTTWATRKPATYFSYASDDRRSSLYAGVTTNTSNAYVTAGVPSIHSADNTTWVAGDLPKDKDTVHVLFGTSATQSGTVSLDVGTSGTAKNVLNPYSNALSPTPTCYPVGNNSQSLGTLVFDAQLNAWIKQGGDSDLGARGLDNATPYEIMLRLCVELGAHPWWSLPPLALTPMTNFTRQLATYVKQNSPSYMVPRYEGPNELWNITGGFYSTSYAKSIATSYGWTASANNYNDWYGKAISTAGQDIFSVYANDTTKFEVILGVNGSSAINGIGTADSNERAASTQYVVSTPQAGYLASAAKNWVTSIATNNYYNPSNRDTGTETTQATAFAGKIFVGAITGTTLQVTNINATASTMLVVGDTLYGNPLFQPGAGPVASGTTVTSVPAAQNITSISQANPAVVTVTTAPPANSVVYISGASSHGMTQLADGWYIAVNPSGATYQLQQLNTVLVNSSTYSAYSGTGATSQDLGAVGVSISQTVSTINMSAATDTTAPATYAATANSGSRFDNLAGLATGYAAWKTWAQGFGIQKMTGYEGSYSPDLISSGNSSVDFLRQASKYATSLYGFTFTNYNNFIGLTGGGFVASFPSHLTFTQDINSIGRSANIWAAVEDLYQSPGSPQWSAIVAFNS